MVKALILFLVPLYGSYINPNSRIVDLNLFEIWNVWDVPHYMEIATKGYGVSGDSANFIVFLPLFPFLVFIFKTVFLTPLLVASFVLNTILTILLGVVFYKLLIPDYPETKAKVAVFFLLIFPTSFFLHIPYTEALFLLLTLLTFYFLRKKLFLIGSLFIALATLTRLSGLALIPVLLLEIYQDTSGKLLSFRTLKLTGVSTGGFLIYLYINYSLWGDPFYFSIIEKQNWHTQFNPFGEGLINAYNSFFWRQGLEKYMLSIAQIGSFLIGFIASLYTLFKIKLTYGVFMLGILFLSYSMSFWLSMPRYILPLFPMYIILAILPNKLLQLTLGVFSVALLIIFSLIFINFGPVF